MLQYSEQNIVCLWLEWWGGRWGEGNGRHLENPKIRDKCMAVRREWTDYHTFVFWVFQMSAIPRVFGLQL